MLFHQPLLDVNIQSEQNIIQLLLTVVLNAVNLCHCLEQCVFCCVLKLVHVYINVGHQPVFIPSVTSRICCQMISEILDTRVTVLDVTYQCRHAL